MDGTTTKTRIPADAISHSGGTGLNDAPAMFVTCLLFANVFALSYPDLKSVFLPFFFLSFGFFSFFFIFFVEYVEMSREN